MTSSSGFTYRRRSRCSAIALSCIARSATNSLALMLSTVMPSRSASWAMLRAIVVFPTPVNTALGHLEKAGNAHMVSPPPKRLHGSFAKYLNDESVRVRFEEKSG